MTDWETPAQLVVWPDSGEAGPDDRPTTTLREAVLAAREIGGERVAWIIMADGHILRPGQIAELQAALRPGA
ncbi:hypothetical protein OPKNFCMD_1730 [Methylobacterium crusticola]|uniref:Uncharacterized protein n=1 Tax=Methylobacterium crusticola TaxID=1697972 RepID=A0ABQ4QUW2_9HYPH|nr:hypothetical protein [Methylobacterium crusticola]GJD49004.1 hypothetical protein OPKNFCMD_1730 [Methylobacterium crusticola]